jgi:H+/Cl- antiporter ClcA/CBS domain-containing protein
MADVSSAPVLSDPPAAPSASWFARLQPSSETIILILAVLIGGVAGMGVVTFRYLIDLIHWLMLENFMGAIAHWGAWTLACVPTLGGIIVGLMRWRWQTFGPGMSALIAAARGTQEISPIRPVIKMVAASVSLGSGASLGPEGPSVEIGANLGMLLGQALRVSQERQQLLLGAGAAAGLAAGFNAPIAGVFFALEVVLGTTFATSAASVVLLAAVVSSLIAQIGLGSQPAFNLPAYEVRSPLELPLYIGLGIGASLVSIAYTRAMQWMQLLFKGEIAGLAWVTRIPRELHPVLGGLCVGVVALKLPQILGVGYETVEAILRDVQFSLPLLLTLLVVKLGLTAISLGSGLVGGIFAPAMYLGAALGAAYGKALPLLLPMFAPSIAAPPAYAMVGMAAVLAASVRAPLTAILLLFELTRDYRIVLPLMAAVGLSVWLLEQLIPSKPSKSKTPMTVLPPIAVNPEKDRKQEVLQTITVAEAMQLTWLRLPGEASIIQAGLILTAQQAHCALVVNASEHLLGIVTLQDINRAIGRWSNSPQMDEMPAPHQTVADICTKKVLYAYPDEPVTEALDRMATRGLRQLPVIDRATPERIVGLVEQEGIALACSLAMTRQALSPYIPQPAELGVGEVITEVAVESHR